jgi:hypothetical protein
MEELFILVHSLRGVSPSWWEGVAKESNSHHGSQEAEKKKKYRKEPRQDISLKDTCPVTYFL